MRYFDDVANADFTNKGVLNDFEGESVTFLAAKSLFWGEGILQVGHRVLII